MQGAQVQSLVGELRSLMLSGVAKQTSKHTPSFPYRHPAQTLPLWAYGIGLRWSAHPRAPLSNDVCPGPLLAHLSCGALFHAGPPGGYKWGRGESTGTASLKRQLPPLLTLAERTPALQEEFKLESPNCSDRCGSCWRSKWGHTLGTLRRHLTPPSTGSFLPRRRPVLLSPAGLGDPLVTAFVLGPHL